MTRGQPEIDKEMGAINNWEEERTGKVA